MPGYVEGNIISFSMTRQVNMYHKVLKRYIIGRNRKGPFFPSGDIFPCSKNMNIVGKKLMKCSY